jgi:hypothetical protein
MMVQTGDRTSGFEKVAQLEPESIVSVADTDTML